MSEVKPSPPKPLPEMSGLAGEFFYPSEDRALLECVILPYFQLCTAFLAQF